MNGPVEALSTEEGEGEWEGEERGKGEREGERRYVWGQRPAGEPRRTSLLTSSVVAPELPPCRVVTVILRFILLISCSAQPIERVLPCLWTDINPPLSTLPPPSAPLYPFSPAVPSAPSPPTVVRFADMAAVAAALFSHPPSHSDDATLPAAASGEDAGVGRDLLGEEECEGMKSFKENAERRLPPRFSLVGRVGAAAASFAASIAASSPDVAALAVASGGAAAVLLL